MKIKQLLLSALIGLGLSASVAYGASVFGIFQGGTNSGTQTNNTLLWYNGIKITATSSNPLTIGSLISTTTATSTFVGPVKSNCFSTDGITCIGGSSGGGITSLATTWPVIGGTITTTGTLSFGGLSTSSAAVIGNIPYFSGVNTFANVATSTASCTGFISCTPFSFIGSGGSTITTTGQLSIANGGTAAATANTALNNLLPSQTSNSGKFLTTDGTNSSWATSGGTGLSIIQIGFASTTASASTNTAATTTRSITSGDIIMAWGGAGVDCDGLTWELYVKPPTAATSTMDSRSVSISGGICSVDFNGYFITKETGTYQIYVGRGGLQRITAGSGSSVSYQVIR